MYSISSADPPPTRGCALVCCRWRAAHSVHPMHHSVQWDCTRFCLNLGGSCPIRTVRTPLHAAAGLRACLAWQWRSLQEVLASTTGRACTLQRSHTCHQRMIPWEGQAVYLSPHDTAACLVFGKKANEHHQINQLQLLDCVLVLTSMLMLAPARVDCQVAQDPSFMRLIIPASNTSWHTAGESASSPAKQCSPAAELERVVQSCRRQLKAAASACCAPLWWHPVRGFCKASTRWPR